MNREVCMYCRYGHKHWATKKIGGYIVNVGDGYYGCHFLPYWGRPVETISECPKIDSKTGKEKEWSLRNACHVNS